MIQFINDHPFIAFLMLVVVLGYADAMVREVCRAVRRRREPPQ